MCRMLAIVSRKTAPVDTLMAFRQLADTGRNFRDFGCPQPNPKSGHPDGWGIACVGQEGEFYARGPGSATADPKYEDTVRRLSRVCSPPLILVAHLRYASKKDTIQERYSHPFRREVDGRVMFFAHNGEIEDFGVREGKIDTQFIYDRFVDSLGVEQRPLAEFKQAIAKAKATIDVEFPRKVESYTFLLIDGDRVIAHRDARTCVPYYTLHETATEDARFVCSEVLPTLPGRWRMLRNGEFVELRPERLPAKGSSRPDRLGRTLETNARDFAWKTTRRQDEGLNNSCFVRMLFFCRGRTDYVREACER